MKKLFLIISIAFLIVLPDYPSAKASTVESRASISLISAEEERDTSTVESGSEENSSANPSQNKLPATGQKAVFVSPLLGVVLVGVAGLIARFKRVNKR